MGSGGGAVELQWVGGQWSGAKQRAGGPRQTQTSTHTGLDPPTTSVPTGLRPCFLFWRRRSVQRRLYPAICRSRAFAVP